MKIYDCFTFFNELNVLELRLKILDPFVDYFVLIEATKTHAGNKKPLYFKENKDRFKRWEKKIIHVIVDDMPDPCKIYFKKFWRLSAALGLGRWKPERYQRNQIYRGLKYCKDEDIIIVSDLDEIPNPDKFNLLKEYTKNGKVVLFNQKLYKFFLNGFVHSNWEGSRACSFKLFKKTFKKKGDRVRRLREPLLRIKMILAKGKSSPLRVIKGGGWHFSYLGNIDSILEKLSNFCHTENYSHLELNNPKKIMEKVYKGEDLFMDKLKINYIPIDESFPKVVYENQKKYKEYIMPIKPKK